MRTCIGTMSLLVFCGFLLGLSMGQKQAVVTFKPEKLYQPFVLQLSHLNLSDPLIEKKTQEFRQNLNLSLTEYAKKHQVVILDKKQVLAGGKDISDEILNRMLKRVQK